MVTTPQVLGGSLFRTQEPASAPWTDCFTGGTLEKPQEQALDGSLLVARQSCTEPGRMQAGGQVRGAEPVGELLRRQDSASAQPPTTLPTLSPRASPYRSQLSRSPELWSSRPAAEYPPHPAHPMAAICCKKSQVRQGLLCPPPPRSAPAAFPPAATAAGPLRGSKQASLPSLLAVGLHAPCVSSKDGTSAQLFRWCHLYFQSWWSFPPF